MAGLFGHQHVDDLCRALSAYARSHCLPSHYFHHFLGPRKFPSLDGLFGGAHNFPCRFHGLSPTQRQIRRGSRHVGFGLYCRGCDLPIFLPRSPASGRLWSLPRLHPTRIRKLSQSDYHFQLYRRFVFGLRSFSQFQALPKRKV